MPIPKLPQFPDFSNLEEVSIQGSFWDSQELDKFNTTFIQTLMNLKQVNRDINTWERKRVALELQYKHEMRIRLTADTGQTETIKKRLAEMELEELEYKIVYVKEVVDELHRIASGLRTDLDALKTLSYNLRAEMRL